MYSATTSRRATRFCRGGVVKLSERVNTFTKLIYYLRYAVEADQVGYSIILLDTIIWDILWRPIKYRIGICANCVKRINLEHFFDCLPEFNEVRSQISQI